MTTSSTPLLGLALPVTGELSGTWGDTVNNSITSLVDSAVAGLTTVSVTSANQALTYTALTVSQARNAALKLTTTTTAAFAVYVPPTSKLYVIENTTAYTATIYNSTVAGNTTAAGSGVAIPAGKIMTVWSDGTNFLVQNSYMIGELNGNAATVTNGIYLGGALGTPSSGTLTNVTGLPIVAGTTGTLSVARGGTGATTSTGSGTVVLATSPTIATPTFTGTVSRDTSFIQYSNAANLSGATFEITGIPSWAKRIRIALYNASTNGTSPPTIRVGNINTIVSSGYTCGNSCIIGTAASSANFTTSFGIGVSTSQWSSSSVISGIMDIVFVTGTNYSANGVFGLTNTPGTFFTGGYVDSGASVISRIQITTAGLSDTYDGGGVVVTYE
jgi:hypothetical protein